MKKTLQLLLTLLLITFVKLSYAQWTNGQAAEGLYGQVNFIAKGNSPSFNTEHFGPTVSVAYTSSKKVIVAVVTSPQNNSHLSLFGDYSVAGNSLTAETGRIAIPSGTYGTVNSVFVDANDNLWVATNGVTNNNLLKYANASSLTSSSLPTATYNLKTYVNGSTPVSAVKGSIVVRGTKLYLADASSHIVARYDTFTWPTTGNSHTANAEAILGTIGTFGTHAGDYLRLSSPCQVALDNNGGLWIADKGNFRVIKIAANFNSNSVPLLTLGRDNYKTTNNSVASNYFPSLTGIAVDGSNRLYVAFNTGGTTQGSKIFIYNTNLLTGNAAATNVLGYSTIDNTFPSINANFPNADAIYNSSNIAVNNDYLWVTDYSWNRLTTYKPSTTLPVTLTALNASSVNGVAKLTWKTSAELNNSHYIVSTSSDGKKFTEVKRVDAMEEAGDYEVSFPVESALYASFGLLSLLFIPRQKKKYLKLLALLIGVAFLAACAKDQFIETKDTTIYIKLEQVDLDGTTTELGIETLKVK